MILYFSWINKPLAILNFIPSSVSVSRSVMHIVGYCFNFYHIATQPVEFLCIFNEIYLRSNFLPDINYWLFGNLIGQCVL